MPKGFNIDANGLQVEVRYGGAAGDFISLTDIAKYRTAENPGYVIQNWMRTRNTVRFLGLWEHFHNPEFNYLEFEAIERETGLISSISPPAFPAQVPKKRKHRMIFQDAKAWWCLQ